MNSWKMYARPVFGAVLLASLILTAPLSAVTAEESVEPSDTAGKALVEKKCSVCHSVDRAYGANKNHSEWTQTVEKMMRYSDRMDFLNQQEKKIVIDFLANRKSSQADSEK
ncbi:Quinohemoprotein amine dehydrogenase alpha subunit haem binding domain-containing protein [Candidatus Electrothrix laxa]